MPKSIDTDAIARATGRDWQDLKTVLDARGAAKLAHREIAALAAEIGGAGDWWAQSIAVAYEQAIGRRAPGQTSDGKYTVSATRIVTGAPEAVFDAWADAATSIRKVGGIDIAGEPTTSRTPKRLYWKLKLADGSRATVAFEAKGAGKTLVAVEHKGAPFADDGDDRKKFWAARLAALAGF